jgi:ribosomal peptide maturation radical SAM protein 1
MKVPVEPAAARKLAQRHVDEGHWLAQSLANKKKGLQVERTCHAEDAGIGLIQDVDRHAKRSSRICSIIVGWNTHHRGVAPQLLFQGREEILRARRSATAGHFSFGVPPKPKNEPPVHRSRTVACDEPSAARATARQRNAPHRDIRGVRSLTRKAELLTPERCANFRSTLQPAGLTIDGFRVGVLYANLLFASLGGEDLYNAIADAPTTWLMGERIFSRAAATASSPGFQPEALCADIQDPNSHLRVEKLKWLEQQTSSFCESVASDIARAGYSVVGASTTFEQTNASVALLDAVKAARPATFTIIGGANCESEMAEGIAALSSQIDYVFSGECEETFPCFLRQVFRGQPLSGKRIIRGSPAIDLDALPEPEFSEYFSQLEMAIPNWKERQIWLPYETSRGCWWGVKHHCTFCGLNGENIAFRQKSPDRIIAALNAVLERNSVRLISMTDNIMPHSFFWTLLPRLAAEIPPSHIFYEQKANLTLEHVRLLERAGVRLIQPGIEAISSSLLQRMKKGCSARQNIALLRYARSLGVATNWNLLIDIPGDARADYEQTLELMPLLHHLHPPSCISSVIIDRFSPYFNAPADYDIRNCRPLDAYALAFPKRAQLEKIAYHFKGDYHSACRDFPELLPRLKAEVDAWKAAWATPKTAPPVLDITPLDEENYLLLDTRGLSRPMLHTRPSLCSARKNSAGQPRGDSMGRGGGTGRGAGRMVSASCDVGLRNFAAI